MWMFCRTALVVAQRNGRRPAASSKRQPGVLALLPGATLDAPLNTRLAEFAEDAAATTTASLQYLSAPLNGMMGIVSLTCLQHSGCSCSPQTIDGHKAEGTASNASASGAFATRAFEINGASAACVVRLTVLNATNSGGHAFKLRQLTLTRARAGGGDTTQTAARKRRRVGGRQREMIKGSF